MSRPLVVLAQRLYHPAGEALLERHVRLRVLESPTPAEVARACADAHALIARYPNRVDAALPAPGGTRAVVVAGQGQGVGGEVVLQASGEGADRSPGPAGPVQEGLRVGARAVCEESAQLTDKAGGMRRAEDRGHVRDEAVEPVGDLVQAVGQGRGPGERPVGVGLPACAAHSVGQPGRRR